MEFDLYLVQLAQYSCWLKKKSIDCSFVWILRRLWDLNIIHSALVEILLLICSELKVKASDNTNYVIHFFVWFEVLCPSLQLWWYGEDQLT